MFHKFLIDDIERDMVEASLRSDNIILQVV